MNDGFFVYRNRQTGGEDDDVNNMETDGEDSENNPDGTSPRRYIRARTSSLESLDDEDDGLPESY